MNRDEQQTLLLKGSIEVEGRVVASSNQALLVTVSLDGLEGQACYKAEAGERPLWDFPDGLWRREVAAYELDVALETGLVHTTVGREDGPFGVGSLQWWVDDNEEDHYFTLREHPQFHDWFAALAAFDVVANNADRKAGHVIYDGERCWAIDNGLCFHEQTNCAPSSGSTPGSTSTVICSSGSIASRTATPVTWATGSIQSSWRSRRVARADWWRTRRTRSPTKTRTGRRTPGR